MGFFFSPDSIRVTVEIVDDQLITFVRDSAARGTSAEITRQQLTSVGWDPTQVDHAIQAVYPGMSISSLSTTVASSIQDNPSRWGAAAGVMVFIFICAGVLGFLYFVTSATHSLSSVNDSLADTKTTGSIVAVPNSTYQNYSNTEFNFQLTIPSEWSYKEYSRSSYGELRLAFGTVRNLPKDYFGDGDYAWIRIFPTSAKSKYDGYKDEIKKTGVTQMSLNGVKAFNTGTMIAGEHKGNVFELHLPTQIENDGSVSYTDVSKRIISSFRFTK